MAARLFFIWNMFTTAKQQDDQNNIRKIRARSRASFDPYVVLSETEFRNRYRLSKAAFQRLCRELRSSTSLKSSQRVTLKEKVSFS